MRPGAGAPLEKYFFGGDNQERPLKFLRSQALRNNDDFVGIVLIHTVINFVYTKKKFAILKIFPIIWFKTLEK